MKLSEKAFKKAVICLVIISALVAISGVVINDDTIYSTGMALLASTMAWVIIKALQDLQEGTLQ